ncbi:MAG: hypothetical protein KDA54_20830 [Phycisphaerales bacterium]|nr:hypothetical protein [Phycisphaerales bacterium]
MSIDCNEIMSRLIPDQITKSRRTGHFPCIKYHLTKLIMGQQQFNDINALIEFCAEPDNLATWLPSPSDRQLIAADLASSLKSAYRRPA